MATPPLTTYNKYTETLTLEELHLSEENRIKINQLIEEFEFIEALSQYNLPIDNKILLYGSTGCGKTATAHAIAQRLDKKIITLHLGGFVSSRLGETAKNITEVFRNARLDKAILFIDEFDFIGKSRDEDDKDAGEMRRIVNTLLQQIDALNPETMLIGATNYVEIIDIALLRRFQLKLAYDLPSKPQLDLYYQQLFDKFPPVLIDFEKKYGISYAEAKDYTYQQVKKNIIQAEKTKKDKSS
ncbi:AAA family ATPase [Flavobacteriaceae bacterium Ap0902]|nr:AAA family ATPase [Flavobacteriaceae bacterium Ap0902]